MVDKRISILSFLALAGIVSAVVVLGGRAGWRSGVAGAAEDSRGTNDTAWALLAEAEELCRSRRARSLPFRGSETSVELRAARSRRAIALEALDIVREIAQDKTEPEGSAVILDRERRLRARCGREHSAHGPGDRSRRSLDGRASSDRHALMAPFLTRLTGVGARGPATRPRTIQAVAIDPPGVLAPRKPDPRPARRSRQSRGADKVPSSAFIQSEPDRLPVASAARSDAAEASREQTPATAPAVSSEIKIAKASTGYRERLRRWGLIFEREAGALRAARNQLQHEIDDRSMTEARGACRSFGVALARLDADLVETAPSRGLSLRIDRMVRRYWQGVAHCTSGRPAAAFSFLSEGDREWGTIAQMAARMFAPKPMKPPRPPGSDREPREPTD